ncbi:pectinesterase inhibitor-like [Carica papaya]|uniref:pectinesterase inhibitor-like n=1 Tax=Carica papaya TaxID=3649 RepID=UPI000B8CBF84|nr:pectinesterase inhibitor-like [Carica papaya]
MNYSSPFFFATFLLILLSFFPHQNAANSKLIDQSCEKTLYKDLCKLTLRSSHESKGADLVGLTKIALKLASSNATRIHSRIDQLLASTKDRNVEQSLKECSEQYGDAIEQIEDSLAALDSEGYADVNTWVTAAMSDADTCEEAFEGQDSPVEGLSKLFGQLCSITLTFSNLLANGGK